MSDAGASRRTKVFGAIRSRLTGPGEPASGERSAAVQQRLAGQPRHLEPERVRRDAAGLKELFKGHLVAGNATVLEAASAAEVPGVVATYLRGQNLALQVRAGADAWLSGLEWSREPSLTIQSGRAEPTDEVGLGHAAAAVAETGTLVMVSGPDNPVTNNFLPETSIILVRARDLVGPYEDAFDRVREIFGRGTMPRTLNMISGPSRTADVGGRLVTGAHGPRRLCVIIVAD